MKEANPLRLLVGTAPITEALLADCRRYVQHHAATLAWHRLFNHPVMRDYPARASYDLDGMGGP